MSLKFNPFYQEGLRKGQIIVKNIENTIYKDLPTALEAKSNYSNLLEQELGYTIKDVVYVENLGIISALKTAIKNQK